VDGSAFRAQTLVLGGVTFAESGQDEAPITKGCYAEEWILSRENVLAFTPLVVVVVTDGFPF
jgi:hypothetical protein